MTSEGVEQWLFNPQPPPNAFVPPPGLGALLGDPLELTRQSPWPLIPLYGAQQQQYPTPGPNAACANMLNAKRQASLGATTSADLPVRKPKPKIDLDPVLWIIGAAAGVAIPILLSYAAS